MKLSHRLGWGAGAAVLAASAMAGLGASAASASTFECNAAANCGTFHSVDNEAVPQKIAFDAKGTLSADGTLVIGYPDLNLDKATSFDKVVHNFGGHTSYTIVYAPNGNWTNQCVTAVGTGALELETCTLGHLAGQRFDAFTFTSAGVAGHPGYGHLSAAPVSIPAYTNAKYVLKNEGSGKYAQDSSVTNPIGARANSVDDRVLNVLGTFGVGPSVSNPVNVGANQLWTWGH